MSKPTRGNKTQPPGRSVDMGQRALREYEEAERRRYHERLRAEKKGAPMQITQEDRERITAIAIIDEVHMQYQELFRTGRCPSCEAISTWKDVDKHPQHEMHEAVSGQEAERYLEWTSKHLPDCQFMEFYRELPNLAARFHIVIAAKEMEIPMQDGSGKVMRDFVPVRVPAPGDPPIATIVTIDEEDDDDA